MAGSERLILQRIVQQGLKKSDDIQGELVFRGSGLEKFHCSQGSSTCHHLPQSIAILKVIKEHLEFDAYVAIYTHCSTTDF
jgi:hypothetical protein